MSNGKEKKKLHTPGTNRTTTSCPVCYAKTTVDKGVKTHRCNHKSRGNIGRNISPAQLQADKKHNAKFNMSLSKVVDLALTNNNKDPELMMAFRRRAGIYR